MATKATLKKSGRRKVRLGHGYSQLDWVRLTQSSSNLSGVASRGGEFTMDQVRAHQNTPHDAWMVIRGKIYNVAQYIPFHPGGVDELLRGVGDDATSLFDEFHPWVNVGNMLEKCFVGNVILGDKDTSWRQVSLAQREKHSARCYRLVFDGIDDAEWAGLQHPFHAKLRVEFGKKVFERYYTPVVRNGKCEFIVKYYPDGVVSRYLTQDMPVDAKDARGAFVQLQFHENKVRYCGEGRLVDFGRTPRLEIANVQTIGMVAGGTGITPMLQLAEHFLRGSCDSGKWPLAVKLVYCNSTVGDVPLEKDVLSLWTAFPKQFDVRFVVTGDGEEEGVAGSAIPSDKTFFGSVDLDLAANVLPVLPTVDETTVMLCCGSPDFERVVKKALLVHGFKSAQVFTF